MSLLRLSSLFLVTLSAGLLLGCPGSDGDDASSTGSPAGTGGAGGAGGAGGTGGTGGTGGVGGSGGGGTGGSLPTDCTDHTSVPENTCSMLKQDCGNGDACRPNGAGTDTTCVSGAGVKGMGASCSDTNECDVGLFCVFFVCAPICCPSRASEFCGSAGCNVRIPFGSSEVWTCNFAKTCTLFENTCPSGQDCRMGDPSQELALCAPGSGNPASEGEPCGFLNDCGANQVCNGGVCRYSCSLADWQNKAPGEGGCPAQRTCNPSTPNYGICQP